MRMQSQNTENNRQHQRMLLAVVASFFAVGTLLAKAPDDAELRAAPMLGDQVASWVKRLPSPPKSIGIFSIFANAPLDLEYTNIVEAEISQGLKRAGVPDVSSCIECRTPQITIYGEKLVIRKGTPDAETVELMGERHPVEAFLTIDLYRTSFYVVAQATLYQNPSGAVIAAERFEVAALKLDESAVQILMTGGLGKVFSTVEQPYSINFNLGIYEELGFGKGGLTAGVLMATTMLIYVNPSISFRGRFGVSAVTYSLNLGAGLGLMGSERGIVIRGSFDVYLGSIIVVGMDGLYYLPEATSTSGINGFAGIHMGFSIGR